MEIQKNLSKKLIFEKNRVFRPSDGMPPSVASFFSKFFSVILKSNINNIKFYTFPKITSLIGGDRKILVKLPFWTIFDKIALCQKF